MASPVDIKNISPVQGSLTDPREIEFAPPNKDSSVSSSPTGIQTGVPSLFNPYAMIVFPTLGDGNYNRIFDGNSSAGNLTTGTGKQEDHNFKPLKAANPSISMLVGDEEFQKKTPYRYTDFLYCKYVGKIRNNQLITLRRYPAPTFDNLEVPGMRPDTPQNKDSNVTVSSQGAVTDGVEQQPEFYPMAQAVTWFGEETGNKLSELLSFSTTLNWKNVEAEVNTVAGNEQGANDGPFSGAAKFLGILNGQVNSSHAEANSQYDPYANGPYAHRVYGPVNVITKTYKRDRGIEFKQEINLNFEYELKSIGSINPKVAMLDLMSNMLALTYNNAAFWGGANRYFPQKPQYPFLGGKDGMNAWYRGQPAEFAAAVGKQITGAATAIGGFLEKLAEDPIAALEGIAAGAAKLGMAAMNKGRAPDILAIKALLTGEPIGEWHMVVGNPYAPIAKVGNLICTGAKFQFNDVIGADDFPTELKVTITLEHGRPRDKGDIESMFNDGQGRIYYAPQGVFEPWNHASSTENSRNDSSWKTGNNKKSYSHSTATFGIFSGSPAEIDKLGSIAKDAGSKLSGTAQRAWQLTDKMFLRDAGSNPKDKK